MLYTSLVIGLSAFVPTPSLTHHGHAFGRVARGGTVQAALNIDLTGKVAFVAGVADSSGYGWSIVKSLTEAGATVAVGTWPPVLGMFEKSLSMGKLDDDLILSDGSKMQVPKIYALDAVYDTPDDVPEDVKTNKRYAGLDGYTISEVAEKVAKECVRPTTHRHAFFATCTHMHTHAPTPHAPICTHACW